MAYGMTDLATKEHKDRKEKEIKEAAFLSIFVFSAFFCG
jgi:hypothetical protein